MDDREVKVTDFPALTDDQVGTILGRAMPGDFIKYRSQTAESPDRRFASVCVSFKSRDSSAGHNIVYLVVRGQGAWASYKGWVTIHSEPWLCGPQELVDSTMMWDSFETLQDAIPELENEIEYTEMVSPRTKSMGGGDAAVLQGADIEWQGSRIDRTLYDLLCVKEYCLATAIISTASRFGSEVPSLVRLFVVHDHIRDWAMELLDKEMATATPLGLLQAESSSMLLWMVTTEVAGCPFLARVLGPTVGDICRSGKLYEMDPARVDPGLVSSNASKLMNTVNGIIDALNNNIDQFPLCCSQILFAVETAVSNTFGLMAHTTVSRYVYHRFLLEAILAPAAVGITDAQPDDNALRTLALVHQIMEKLCTVDGVFERSNPQERHLVPLNQVLDEAREHLDSFTSAVVSIGAPYSPVAPAAYENGGVVFAQSDVDAVHAYLSDHFVEVFSSISDIRSEAVAAEITARLRPILFSGASKGPSLPVGQSPAPPHPIGLTNTAYQTRVPAPMGSEPPALTAAFQSRALAMPPPASTSATGSTAAINSAADIDPLDRVGLGIIFRKDAYGLYHVLTMTKGGPAHETNVIEVDDVIMEINGRQVVGMSLSQLKQIIMGPIGTPVKMVFERPRGPSTERYEVTVFRGNLDQKAGASDQISTQSRTEMGEGMRVFQEIAKLVCEVDELQQRRMRGEKALQAAEQLRQEYEKACDESDARVAKLEGSVLEVKDAIKKTRVKRDVMENKIEDLKKMYQDIASGKKEAPKPRPGKGKGKGKEKK